MYVLYEIMRPCLLRREIRPEGVLHMYNCVDMAAKKIGGRTIQTVLYLLYGSTLSWLFLERNNAASLLGDKFCSAAYFSIYEKKSFRAFCSHFPPQRGATSGQFCSCRFLKPFNK